jgi:uncharacterized SAM-binding protein YcdF (DUF218 family)
MRGGGRAGPRTKARSWHRRLDWKVKLALAGAGVVAAFYAMGAIARVLAPTANTKLTRFDAIIVLGSPADGDGNPSPTELARVAEGVREYERGVAPRIIFTGGLAHNRFVEAEVMARAAHAEGIPEEAIVVEGRAMNTVQNACYSVALMKAHGWQSAEVVSSASHLQRAGLIFSAQPVEWRTHAAPALGPDAAGGLWGSGFMETLKTVHFLIWGRWMERCAE